MTTSLELIQFAIVFLMGFVFSLMGIMELARSLDKKKSSFTAIIFNLLAAIIWFPFSIIWFASADVTMYFGFGYLWLALGFTFSLLTLLSVGLQMRYSVKPEEQEALTIKERRM